MRVAVEDGGFTCDDWEVRGDDAFSVESADCTSALVFAIYENASLNRDHRDGRNILLSIIWDVAYDLSGPNWNAGCGDNVETCEELMPLLGGEIIVSDLTEG